MNTAAQPTRRIQRLFLHESWGKWLNSHCPKGHDDCIALGGFVQLDRREPDEHTRAEPQDCRRYPVPGKPDQDNDEWNDESERFSAGTDVDFLSAVRARAMFDTLLTVGFRKDAESGLAVWTSKLHGLGAEIREKRKFSDERGLT